MGVVSISRYDPFGYSIYRTHGIEEPVMGTFIDFRFVKENASFEAVLRHYGIHTKGSGDERSALCPLHEEKKPSFKDLLKKF